MDAAICDAAHFGQQVGGQWCSPSSPANIFGYNYKTCIYEADIQGSGNIVSGSSSTSGETLDLGTTACSSWPAFTFDQSIDYNGQTYRAKGSCPVGALSSCSVSLISPSGGSLGRSPEGG